MRLIFGGPRGESSSGECGRNHDFVSTNVGGAADGRPTGLLDSVSLYYQVPLTQLPLIAAPPEPAVLHERVVAPPVRMIEKVLPSVEAAVTV